MTPPQRRGFLGAMLRGDRTCADLAKQLVDGFHASVTRESLTPALTREACVGALATFLEGEHNLLANPTVWNSPDMAPGTPTLPALTPLCATSVSLRLPRYGTTP